MLGVLLAALATTGCAPRPLLGRAIRARGGPLPALTRSVEATVTAEYPGTWTAVTTFQRPERIAWSIDTRGQANHYLFDGEVVRAFIGAGLVATDAGPEAPLRRYARFTAVTLLDALERPDATVEELAPAAVPPGAVAALAVRFADRPERFVLGFDDADRLVSVEGPLDLPGLGLAPVRAEFSEFARVDGWLLPRRVRYLVGGRVLIDERARGLCPEPDGLGVEAFRDPTSLPACR